MKDEIEVVQQIRAFNRFYTVLIGLLDGGLLNSEYSLAEARILYEIQAGQQVSASQIIETLNIDKGYMSRILKKLIKDNLVLKQISKTDARVYFLFLTDKGQKLFNELNDASNKQVGDVIKKLSLPEKRQLALHLTSIQTLLKKA